VRACAYVCMHVSMYVCDLLAYAWWVCVPLTTRI